MSFPVWTDYVRRLRFALEEARSRDAIPALGSAFTLYAFTLIYAAAWFLVAPARARHPFFQEGGPIDWMSSLYLAAAAILAWATWAGASRGVRDSWIWLVCAIGLLYFAIDERFQVHEQAGNWFYQPFIEGGPPFGLRKWNDLTVILYGVVALVVVLLALPSLVRHRNVRLFLGLAFVFYALHTGIDAIGGAFDDSWVKEPLEESFKLLAGASLVLSFLQAALAETGRAAAWHDVGPRHAIPLVLLTGIHIAVITTGGSQWQMRITSKWGEPGSWLVSIYFGCAALLTWSIASTTHASSRRRRTFYVLLSLVLLFLALDEGVAAQRRFGGLGHSLSLLPFIRLDAVGVLHRPYGVTGLILSIVVAAIAVIGMPVLRANRNSGWLLATSVLLIAATGTASAMSIPATFELVLLHLAAVSALLGCGAREDTSLEQGAS